MSHFPVFTLLAFIFICRERPAAIPIEIKSIDDTSNFDEFPESDILQPGETATVNSKFPSVPCQNTPHAFVVCIHFSDALTKLVSRSSLCVFFEIRV